MDTELSTSSFRYDNDDRWFEMIVECSHIPSVNNQYMFNKGRVFKAPVLVKFGEELAVQIKRCNPRSVCPWLIPDGVYDLHLNFLMNGNFWKRDTSNCIKSTEDVLFESLGINDNRVLRHFDTKSSIKKSKMEKIIMRVAYSDFDYDYFNR